MPASMKWCHLGIFQLLSRVIAVMAEMEVSPQEDMGVTRKEWKCSSLRDMGFLKILCLFVLYAECNRRHSYLLRIDVLSGVRYSYSGRHQERLCASGLHSPELMKRRRLQITDIVSVQDARMGFHICIVGY